MDAVGVGLGLAIVDDCVIAMNSTITVESTKEAGRVLLDAAAGGYVGSRPHPQTSNRYWLAALQVGREISVIRRTTRLSRVINPPRGARRLQLAQALAADESECRHE